MTNVKKAAFCFTLSLILFAALAVTLASCFSPWTGGEELTDAAGADSSGTGSVTITIGGGTSGSSSVSYIAAGKTAAGNTAAQSRAVWTDDDKLPWDGTVRLNDLRHDISLAGGPGRAAPQTRIISPGGGIARFSELTEGSWEITVKAYLPGTGGAADELKAVGRKGIEIEAGQSKTERVEMAAPETSNVTVTFNVNGGSGTAPESQTVAPDTEITLPDGTGLSMANHTFGGWWVNSDGTGAFYTTVYDVTSSITLYARWVPDTYTVTFVPNGGLPVPPNQAIAYGGTVTEPPAMTNTDGSLFAGWYKELALTNEWDFDTDTVTEPTTLHAKWEATGAAAEPIEAGLWKKNADNSWTRVRIEDASFITSSINEINNTAAGEYRMIIGAIAELSVTPKTLSIAGTRLTIRADGEDPDPDTRVITLSSSSGSFFTVEAGVELTLDAGITLVGRAPLTNSAALVIVNGTNAKLIMKDDSTIKDNISTSANNGGGVYVSEGSFDMLGGTIEDNTVSTSGGGVYFAGTTFTMSGTSAITGNTATTTGGGVYVASGSVTMLERSSITGNNAEGLGGGGVVVVNEGSFEMKDNSIISGNSAQWGGAGYLAGSGTFTMSGGTIWDNTASSGGGLYLRGGTFTKPGPGEIKENTADPNSGAAVYVTRGDYRDADALAGDEINTDNGTGLLND